MQSTSIKKIVPIILTFSLIAVLAFFIKTDFIKVKGVAAVNPLMKGLTVQREKVKHKAMMVTINHYRPDLSQWQVFLRGQTAPDQRFFKR